MSVMGYFGLGLIVLAVIGAGLHWLAKLRRPSNAELLQTLREIQVEQILMKDSVENKHE